MEYIQVAIAGVLVRRGDWRDKENLVVKSKKPRASDASMSVSRRAPCHVRASPPLSPQANFSTPFRCLS